MSFATILAVDLRDVSEPFYGLLPLRSGWGDPTFCNSSMQLHLRKCKRSILPASLSPPWTLIHLHVRHGFTSNATICSSVSEQLSFELSSCKTLQVLLRGYQETSTACLLLSYYQQLFATTKFSACSLTTAPKPVYLSLSAALLPSCSC